MCDVFFFNDTATTEIYTLSLHDALPISAHEQWAQVSGTKGCVSVPDFVLPYFGSESAFEVNNASFEISGCRDRKSTRLNSSHGYISYAVFCLKKKKNSAGRTRPSSSSKR